MQVYLAVTPGELQAASAWGKAFAHVAYRIGPGSCLLRQNLLLQTRGGLLSVSDREAPPIAEPERLCAAVLRECRRQGYSGAVADFEEPPTGDRRRFLERLAAALSAVGLALYVPEDWESAAPGAFVLVGTAMSGGSLSQRLREAVAARAPGRVALDLERLRMDFLLPARTGLGKPLTGEQLETLMKQERPSVFFSQDLCARYFTYLRNGETHFVLFDDAGTLRQKLKLGMEAGCAAAFFMWPEIRDLAGQLFPASGPQSSTGGNAGISRPR